MPEEHDNSMTSRTVGAICLGPSGSASGAHYFLNVATGKRITRQHWTELPAPQTVIARITALGAEQSMPQTLTFADRHGNELLDEDDEEDDDHDSAYSPPDSDSDSDYSADSDSDSASTSTSVSTDSQDDDDDGDSVQLMDIRHPTRPPTAGVNNNTVNPAPTTTATTVATPTARRRLTFESPSSIEAANDSDDQSTSTTGVEAENAGVQAGNTGVDPENAGVEAGNTGVDPENAGVETDEDDQSSTENMSHQNQEQLLDAVTADMQADIDEGNQLLEATQGTSTEGGNETAQHSDIDSAMDAKYGPRESGHNLRPRKMPDFSHLHTMFHVQVALLTEQMSAKRGLKVFGNKGAEAIITEMHQVHYHRVLKPKFAKEVTKQEKRDALHHLMFLKEKRCGKIKARGCANGRKQRLWKTKEETSSPTVRTKSCFISSVIDAKEGRAVFQTWTTMPSCLDASNTSGPHVT